MIMLDNLIFIVAKKEILDNIRNKWIIFLSIIFAVLTIVFSYFGALFSQGWQDLGGTIAAMMNMIQFFIPIIALMLGYTAIIGEIERGSMSALLALPATKQEILVGKFIGLGSILAVTITMGFGVAGIIIAANVSNVDFAGYTVFIGLTILFALVFLSLAMFFSTIFKKRSTSMGGAIFTWFLFVIILPIIFLSMAITSTGLDTLIEGNLPDWYYAIDLINPLSVYATLVSINVVPIGVNQLPIEFNYPSFYSNPLLVSILLCWILVFLLLSYFVFTRKDI